MQAISMVELWRGALMESRHSGHAVVWHAEAGLLEAWGNPAEVIYPRSSCKMLQALPLMESGAGAGLTAAQIALSCASHQGAALHVEAVRRWLADMDLGAGDLRCGAHEPSDRTERNRLIRADEAPCQCHNNCSGKHTGFLMMNKHLKGDADYHLPDHPLQRAIRQTFEEVTGEASAGFGIDGCSAPNFATSIQGLARAMAAFAGATGEGDARDRAMFTLSRSMSAHPEYVAGEGRACTELMRAMDHRVAIKTGAEAVFVAIAPQKRLGMAVKIVDGATRASEAAITALLVRYGLLDAHHPMAVKRLNPVQKNWNGMAVGQIRLAAGFPSA